MRGKAACHRRKEKHKDPCYHALYFLIVDTLVYLRSVHSAVHPVLNFLNGKFTEDTFIKLFKMYTGVKFLLYHSHWSM